MMHPTLASALVVVATWESWRFYFGRVAATPDDALALIVVVLVVGMAGVRRSPLAPVTRLPLAALALLLAGYAASRLVLPPIARAGLAVALTLFCFHVTVFRQRPPPAVWGLSGLALPILPSLQFVLGYPLRVAAAALTVGRLNAHGLAVERQGTFLVWQGATVQLDAPCSGVSMLWVGLLFTLLACTLLELGAVKTLVAAVSSLVLAIAGNVLRTASLFYIETGFTAPVPSWWHEAIGLAAFALSTGAMGWVLVRLQACGRPLWGS
jgi:exosortase/archaeosortase family protein